MELGFFSKFSKTSGSAIAPCAPLQFRRLYSTNADFMQRLNYENGKSQQKHATGLWRQEKVHWDM
jgi:hypothetical protein